MFGNLYSAVVNRRTGHKLYRPVIRGGHCRHLYATPEQAQAHSERVKDRYHLLMLYRMRQSGG